MKNLLSLIVIATLFVSCKTTEEVQSCGTATLPCEDGAEVIVEDNSETALDWVGTYKGVVPCDDCDGMEITLTLRDDENYRLEIVYIGKDQKPVVEDYVFTWNIRGDIVMLSNREFDLFEQFQVVENAVYLLVHNGEDVSEGDTFNQAFKLDKQ
jgi:uncharacterized lipoprotein NlpE involved in copper resistance